MAKMKIKELAVSVLTPFLEENGLELYHIEYVKEGKERYLRVFLDKKSEGDEEEYISIEDCEKVSRYLSAKLDEEDPVEENYFLEVSPPGMDRTLYTQADYERFTGRLVDVSLYKAIDGSKTLTGELKSVNGECIVISNEKNEETEIPFSQISKTKLAVVF